MIGTAPSPPALPPGLRGLVLGLALVLGGAIVAPVTAAEGLRPGEAVEGEVAEAPATFTLQLPPAAVWGVRAVQKNGNLVVEARPEDGGEAVTVDGPLGVPTPEVLLLEGGALGRRYALELRVREQQDAVRFRLTVTDLTTAPEARRAAEAAMSEGGAHHHRKTTEDWREAMEKYRQAQVLWRELGRDGDAAQALSSVATLHRRLGEPQPALELYREALAAWQTLGEPSLVAATLNDMGLCLWKLGRDGEARENFLEALSLERQLDHSRGAAVVHNNLCLLSHSRGLLQEALECYQGVLREMGEGGDRGLRAVLLNNIGSVYDTLGEPERALENLLAAFAIREAVGDPMGQAQSLINLAVHHRRLGEPEEALRYYGQALEIQRRLGNTNLEANTLNNLGYAYMHLGELERAATYFEPALALWRRVGDQRGEVRTLINLGALARDQGDLAQALGYLEEALGLAREGGDHRGESLALILLARVHLDREDTAAAAPVLDRAAVLESQGESRRQRGEWFLEHGRYLLLTGDRGAARWELEEALRLYARAGDRASQVRSLLFLARLERAEGDLKEALGRVEDAVSILESMRGAVTNPFLRGTFFDSKREAYELLLQWQMELQAQDPEGGERGRGLEISERARARTLLDLVGESGSGLLEEVPAELLKQRRVQRRRLNAKANQQAALFRAEGETEALARVEQERQRILAELDRVEFEIRRASPRYSALVQRRTIRAGEIRGLLEPGTWLLEYSLGTEVSYLWLVTPEGVESFSLPPRKEIEAAAVAAYEELSHLDLRSPRRQEWALEALAHLVLGPLRDRLDGQRLVVVADGALQYIPFAALPGRDGAPLLVRHEIVSLPSASVLAAQRRQLAARAPAPKVLAVLADPVFSVEDPRVTSGDRLAAGGPSPSERPATPPRDSQGSPQRSASWERLLGTRREAQAIAGLVEPQACRLALGFEASRATALDPQMAQYRILHFATHGELNAQRPELSGLVLSSVDARGDAQDGFLRLHDVYGLRLGAEMVVLSGCQTALGREVKGEGLVGLTRGFMYAGVPRVVSSLWRVPDEATAELMTRFYNGHLKAGLPASQALRQAQLSLYRQRSSTDPYHWAAFLFQGDWR